MFIYNKWGSDFIKILANTIVNRESFFFFLIHKRDTDIIKIVIRCLEIYLLWPTIPFQVHLESIWKINHFIDNIVLDFYNIRFFLLCLQKLLVIKLRKIFFIYCPRMCSQKLLQVYASLLLLNIFVLSFNILILL